MLVRIGFLNIPVWEIALALAILIATICMMIGLTSRVYRGGVLIYGKGAFSNIKKAIKLGKNRIRLFISKLKFTKICIVKLCRSFC